MKRSFDEADIIAISSDSDEEVYLRAAPLVHNLDNSSDLRPNSPAWHGAIKLTPFHSSSQAERAQRHWITFQELIQPDELQDCVFSSMVIDWSWFLAHFADGRARAMLCIRQSESKWDKPRVALSPSDLIRFASPRSAAPQTALIEGLQRLQLTVLHPSLHGSPYGSMHTKLMLLYYPNHVRFVCSSANLVPYDYDTVQNIVFYQDFPRKSNSGTVEAALPPVAARFVEDLKVALEDLGLHLHERERLDQYDFSKAAVTLVLSKPGSFPIDAGTQARSYGMQHLAKQIEKVAMEYNLIDSEMSHRSEFSVEYAASSIGSLTRDWAAAFVRHVCRAFPFGPRESDAAEDVSAVLRIIYPTQTHVLKSPDGPPGFGTMFCSTRAFMRPSFPRASFAQLRGVWPDGRYLSLHAKIMSLYVTEGGRRRPVVHYLGSHNVSASAWGSLTKGNTQLTVRNYELGLLLPESSPATTFLPRMIFPYETPPPPYAPGDVPWQQEQFE